MFVLRATLDIFDGVTSMNSSVVAVEYKNGKSDQKMSRYDQLMIRYHYNHAPANHSSAAFAFQLEFHDSGKESKTILNPGMMIKV